MPEVALRWLGVVSFEIVLNNQHIIVDPFITDAPYNGGLTSAVIERADLLLLSHCHWDHIMDIPDIMRRFNPPLLTGERAAWEMVQWLDCSPSRVYPMWPGMELDFDFVRVQALPGRHTDLHRPLSQLREHFAANALVQRQNSEAFLNMQLVGSFEYRNYLLTTPQGKRILIWGNDPTVEQRNLLRGLRPDIALLQYSKQKPDDMIRFAADIGAQCFIPHHMDLKRSREQYQPLIDKLQEGLHEAVPEIRFIQPEYNHWYTF